MWKVAAALWGLYRDHHHEPFRRFDELTAVEQRFWLAMAWTAALTLRECRQDMRPEWAVREFDPLRDLLDDPDGF
jgi:hypothetical protein